MTVVGRLVPLLLAVVLGAGDLSAQELSDTAFDARTLAELRRVLGDARAAGLPTAPLVNRALQGAARGVTGTRVVAIVRAHADSMRVARESLGRESADGELDAGGAALRAGVTRDALRRVREVRGTGAATTALVVLTDLVRRGIASPTATDAVTSLAAKRNDDALLSLQTAIAQESVNASPQRLQEVLRRFAAPIPPMPNDSPERRETTGAIPATDEPPTPTRERAISLFTLSPTPDGEATVFHGDATIGLGRVMGFEPAAAARARLGDGAPQWSTGMTVGRRWQPRPTVGARAWISGDIRAVTPLRRQQPFDTLVSDSIGAPQRIQPGFGAGLEISRTFEKLSLRSGVGIERDRVPHRATVPVGRRLIFVNDTLTPRPDTLRPQWITEYGERWLSLDRTVLRGSIGASIGRLQLDAGFTRRQSVLPGPFSGSGLGSTIPEPVGPATLTFVTAEQRLSKWATLFAQYASREPSDVVGPSPSGDARFRLGFRLHERSQPVAPATPPNRLQIANFAVELVARGDSTGSRVRIRVRAPGASRVWLDGDLTRWAAEELSRAADGEFVGEFRTSQAVLRLRLRVDGSAWLAPPGVPVDVDEFGGSVGVVVLP